MLCQGKQCNVSYTAQQNMKAIMYLQNNDLYHLKAGKAYICWEVSTLFGLTFEASDMEL